VAICEYCGYPQLARRRIRIALGLVLAAVAIAAAIVGASRLMGSRESEAVGSEPTGPIVQTATEDTTTRNTVPVVPPIEAQPVPAPSPPPTTRETTRPVADTSMRWAVDWANVREGPGTDYPIVGVLQPGTPVTAASRRRGWWLVSVDGSELGYVAGNLLTDQPPTP
jgi:uncharacterized protein YgiM (DUF1202 family)